MPFLGIVDWRGMVFVGSSTVVFLATVSAAVSLFCPRIRITESTCALCGYDLEASGSIQCPECGFGAGPAGAA